MSLRPSEPPAGSYALIVLSVLGIALSVIMIYEYFHAAQKSGQREGATESRYPRIPASAHFFMMGDHDVQDNLPPVSLVLVSSF